MAASPLLGPAASEPAAPNHPPPAAAALPQRPLPAWPSVPAAGRAPKPPPASPPRLWPAAPGGSRLRPAMQHMHNGSVNGNTRRESCKNVEGIDLDLIANQTQASGISPGRRARAHLCAEREPSSVQREPKWGPRTHTHTHLFRSDALCKREPALLERSP